MALGLDKFISSLKSGGYRPNLFEVSITGNKAITDLEFKAKATTLPNEEIGVIEVPYMGRKMKVAGDRTYPEWTITVIADEGLEVRKQFEEWLNSINKVKENTTAHTAPADYMSEGTIKLYNKDGSEGAEYTLSYIWPSSIGDISLSWETTDEIAEFEVTLQIQYFDRTK